MLNLANLIYINNRGFFPLNKFNAFFGCLSGHEIKEHGSKNKIKNPCLRAMYYFPTFLAYCLPKKNDLLVIETYLVLDLLTIIYKLSKRK